MDVVRRITLECVLPQVFADQPEAHASQVWCTTLTLDHGAQYLIEAESGTGKSSLCSYIYGARTDYQGHILFDGRDVRTLTVADWTWLRRYSLALLPQEMRLFPELTALDNVLIKNQLTQHLSLQDIRRFFERLEIADKIDTPAVKLSIGQQQRVAIIRALAQPFTFLLLDEPVSHLDSRNNAIVAALIEEEASRQGASIVTTSVGNPLMLSHQPNILKL